MQSLEMSGYFPHPASEWKRKVERCSRTLGVPLDCHQPWKTPEVPVFINVYLDPHPQKDGGVIRDQQQEMEANVLTPKTFYSFCLVLHLPPRAAAFIPPFE